MNYNLFFKILLILAIITTVCVFCAKPKMHTTMLVYNSDYTIVEPKVETTVEKSLPTVTQKPQQRKKVEDVVDTFKSQQSQQIEQPKKVSQAKTKATKNVQQTKKLPEQKTVKTKQQQPVQTKKLSEQEEEIAWNKWRSNLQNNIMRDTQLPFVEQGTVFKFTFNVDKFGRVSNVKTWSQNPAYTPFAIEYIAPVIRSYQGKSILNFPNGSSRLTTTVDGGWKIAGQQRYSTPQDYNDIEKVRK